MMSTTDMLTSKSKTKQRKMPFEMYISPIFGEIISRHGVKPDLHKLKMLTEMPPPKTKKEFQSLLGIVNYLSKFSFSTVNVCESLRQLTWSKTERTWNATYQKLFDKTKSIIKEMPV